LIRDSQTAIGQVKIGRVLIAHLRDALLMRLGPKILRP